MSPPRPSSSRLAGPVALPTAPALPRLAPTPVLQKIEAQFSILPQYYSREDLLSRLLQGYFREAHLEAGLNFGPTTLVVDDSPDLQIRDGAGICAEARIHQGQVSFTRPLQLGGFYALGGFYDFCSVDTDEAGKLHLKSCDCSLPKDSDITEPALKGPLARLFPEKKVHPVPLTELLKVFMQPGEAQGGDDPFLSALRSVQLKARVPSETWVDDPPGTPGGSCHPITASMEAYLNLPKLKDNLAAGLWRSFDFSGLERGSKILWPRFDLSNLPLPQGWSIPEGSADIEVRYFAEEGTTQIQIRNLDARAKIQALFADSELKIQGDAQLILRRGGEIELQTEGLRIEAPLASIEASGLPNISAILHGKAGGKFKDGAFSLAQLRFSLSDLQFQVPPQHPSPLGASGLSWHGTLIGQGEVEYDGSSKLWKSLLLELSGDLSVLNPEGSPLLTAKGLALELKGSSDRLTLEGDALALSYGAAAIQPRFAFNLRPKLDGENWQVEGDGSLSLSGINVPLAVTLDLELRAQADQGRVNAASIAFDYDGRKWTRKGRAEVSWSEKGLDGQIHLPDLPGGNALDLNLRRAANSDRLNGSFKFRPSRLNLAPGLYAEDLKLKGSFSTGPWSGLLAKPRASVNARIEGKLDGLFGGPLAAELLGSVSYSPTRRSVFLWLDPRRRSALHVGPVSIPGESRNIEADLPLKGTWQAVLLPRGVLIGGRGVGVQGAEVSVGDGAS
ncbi:MAG TPA: hypothetical protein VJP40_05185, partial [bacterium]|nr:hypothetical protein [bacterium]